jgi:hypothetical protein
VDNSKKKLSTGYPQKFFRRFSSKISAGIFAKLCEMSAVGGGEIFFHFCRRTQFLEQFCNKTTATEGLPFGIIDGTTICRDKATIP